jgi:hypothetical protein
MANFVIEYKHLNIFICIFTKIKLIFETGTSLVLEAEDCFFRTSRIMEAHNKDTISLVWGMYGLAVDVSPVVPPVIYTVCVCVCVCIFTYSTVSQANRGSNTRPN